MKWWSFMNSEQEGGAGGNLKGCSPDVICPVCRVTIKQLGTVRAVPCSLEDCPCEIRNGVVCANLVEAEFGEANSGEMRELLDLAITEGWKEAINAKFTGSRRFVNDLVANEKRARFVELLDLDGTEDILDIGCGYGGIAAQLSGKVRSVTALDITLERISMLEIRKSQDGLENIQTVCNGDILKLPFRDDSFDVISLIGVMEYFPISLPSYDIWEAHAKSMQEICRVLKPRGQLVLGVKNRFGWPYFMGKQDHNNLSFGPILPWRIANAFSRLINKKSYRIISHGNRGYKRLLRASGFGDIYMYWPVDGYQMPSKIVALNRTGKPHGECFGGIENPVKRTLVRLLNKCGLLQFIAPQFFVVANKLSIERECS
jgi:SAM-dependent methyltransferase